MHQSIRRIAFLAVVLGVFGATALWAVRQEEAYRREAEAMGRAPEPYESPTAVGVARVEPLPKLISVVTSSGRPLAGTKIYANDFAGGYTERLGTSDAKGRVSIVRASAGLALAPDGRITLLDDSDKVVFGPQAKLRLHLTDGKGTPGAGRKITIVPNSWLPSYDEMGVVDRVPQMAPELQSRLSRTTDASGAALFTGLGKGQAFQVFVHLDSERTLSFDKLVRAGTRKEIVVARDRRIEGRVTRAAGEPLAGMKVELTVTNDGRFPTLTQRWTTTDRDGRYHFDHLLTCGYSIRLHSPAKTLGETGWTEARSGSGPWIPRGEWEADDYLRLWPKERVTRCDYRWTKAAHLDVELTLASPALELKRIFLRKSGKALWTDSSVDGGRTHFTVYPETYEVYMETKRRTEERSVEGYLGKVTLAEDERKTVRFTAGR